MASKNSLEKALLIMLILIGSAIFLSLAAAAAPKWPIPDGVKTMEVNGYDMAYQETGSGVPLILIHGAVNDYRTWALQVPELSKTYRTIPVSLRHCYPEKWNGLGDDCSVTQHVSDVAALIRSMNLGKVHLLGHSRGGEVALNVARLHPETIRTLILEDANMENLLPKTPETQRREAAIKGFREYLRGILAAGDAEKAAKVFVDAVNGPGTWDKLPPERRITPVDNIGTAMESAERPKVSCVDIQKFNFPILLLIGERSPKHNGIMIEAIRQCKPEILAPLIVPNGTHLMHRDNPEFFNKSVLDFLKKH